MWRQNLCQGLDLDKDLNSADVDDKGAWSSIHDENIREEIQRDVSPVSFRRRSHQSFENAKTSDLLNERHMITDIIFCIENNKKIKYCRAERSTKQDVLVRVLAVVVVDVEAVKGKQGST